jgi:hypothetical protein
VAFRFAAKEFTLRTNLVQFSTYERFLSLSVHIFGNILGLFFGDVCSPKKSERKKELEIERNKEGEQEVRKESERKHEIRKGRQ